MSNDAKKSFLSKLSGSHWYNLRILVRPELQNQGNLVTQLNASD